MYVVCVQLYALSFLIGEMCENECGSKMVVNTKQIMPTMESNPEVNIFVHNT